MKIRLILFSLVGVAAYIVLANFNSNMIKETSVSKGHDQAPPQTHTVMPPVSGKSTASTSAPVEHPRPAPQKAPEPPPVQLAIVPPVDNTGEMQKLQAEIAQKDQQIRQLLDAQEAIATKYRTFLTETEAGAAKVEAKEQMLKESAERIKSLIADKEKTAAELTETKVGLEQLNQNFKQMKAASVEAYDKTLKESAERIKALVSERDKTAAELIAAKAAQEQLRQNFEQMKAAGAKAEQSIKEKEVLLNTVQIQIQERIGESSQLKAQLAETVDKLMAAKAELDQAGKKAEALIRLDAEKEKQTATLNEQKAAVEKSLEEKSAAFDKAILSIQSLRQEVAAQPQAVATVQNLLDERNKEFEQMKKEASVQIGQLSKQVADLSKNENRAATELDKCKAEAENARKKVEGLEASEAKAQTALTEAERNLAAALENKNTLQNQLNDKEAALSGVQGQINALSAKTSSLSDEKLGLTSQLEALLADQKNLLAMKASFEEQAVALSKAEAKLKDMAVLQAKNEEMSKTLAEKTAALEKAAQQGEELASLQAKHNELAKQAETSTGAIKQLEAEKADLAGQLATAQAMMQNVDGLKKSLDEKSTALMLAETKIKDLTAVSEQVATLETKLAAAQTAKQAAEKKTGETENSVKNLSESLAASSGKLKNMESELAAAQSRIKELTDKDQLRAQQDLVPNLNQQIATLRDQIVQVETVSTQTKKDLSDAIAAVQTRTAEAQAADKKAQALLAEKETLQQSLNSSQATMGDLQKQLEAIKEKPASPAAAVPAANREASTALDTDKDGVHDAVDLCPDSPAGSAVNDLGCPAKKSIVLEGVNFNSGTAVLTPESLKKLDLAAAALSHIPKIKIEVAGYTDSVGDAKRNQNLSVQRSQAVVKYLTGKGVAAAQLSAKGYGPENPIADNTTPEGRQKNRRIELHPLAQ